MEEEITRLVEKYSDMIFHIALHNTGNYADAEDILQEVLMKCYINKIHLKKDEEEIKAWLIRVTINQCKDLHKASWNKKRSDTEIPEERNLFLAQEKRFSEEYMDVLDGLQKLSFEERNIIYLDYLGYKNREIAKLMHINPNSVNTKLQRAKKIIQNYCV